MAPVSGTEAHKRSVGARRRRYGPTVMADEVLYDVDEHVARLTINRPDKRNALSWTVMGDLRRALAEAKSDRAVRALVLTGAGERAFCAGADLTGMAAGASYAELHDARGEMAGLFREMWELGKPIVARVFGYCLAGGFGLALACDIVVAADDAVFGTPEIDLGLWPYMITVPLTRSMPRKQALELMMTGRRVSAADGERLGFVNHVVPADRLDGTVDDIATTLAAKPPVAMKLGRDSFYGTWADGVDDALPLLHALLTITASTDDAAEGIAAFAEKREPVWRGR